LLLTPLIASEKFKGQPNAVVAAHSPLVVICDAFDTKHYREAAQTSR